MKATLKFYYHDATLPSYPVGKNEPNSGQVIPVDVEIGGVPEKGSRIDYGGKKRRVLEVTLNCDVAPGEPVAVVLVE